MSRPAGGFIFIFIYFFFYTSASSQKIKYKDLFYLLDAEKYEEGEPFLRQFLADEKNNDHPNAHYQMALVFSDKIAKSDIFKNGEDIVSYTDSCFYFYALARQFIDEKEVKRNDEYYHKFLKRDVRTGKVSIKVFDVHFAIDEDIKRLEKRRQDIEIVNTLLKKAISIYAVMENQFRDLRAGYDNYNQLLLRSDLMLMAKIDKIATQYDSFHVTFEKIHQKLLEIPRSGYGQKLDPIELSDFEKDGLTEVDFLALDVAAWDYGQWAKSTKNTITQQILPIKYRLAKADESLDQLLTQALTDSNSISGEIGSFINEFDPGEILTYDSNPLPLKLIELRLAELNYYNTFFSNNSFRDSVDYTFRISLNQKEAGILEKVHDLATNIASLNIDEHLRNFKDFVDQRYSGYLGLDQYIKSKLEFSSSLIEELNKLNDQYHLRNAYTLYQNDTIYIDSLGFSVKERYHHPLGRIGQMAAGIKLKGDTLSGYLVEVTPARVTDFYVEIPIDSLLNTKESKVSGISDMDGQVYYLLYHSDNAFFITSVDSTSVQSPVDLQDEFLLEDSLGSQNAFKMDTLWKATIAKVYRADGLSWASNIVLKGKPDGIKLLANGELQINLIEYAGANAARKPVQILVDKEGKLVTLME
ncbi:MAG: hypothetical protein OEX02_03470 [Cyclobacteriaceae bacterium]|nr:hypothetical protein [Cyclobacteriaceae bacterium]